MQVYMLQVEKRELAKRERSRPAVEFVCGGGLLPLHFGPYASGTLFATKEAALKRWRELKALRPGTEGILLEIRTEELP